MFVLLADIWDYFFGECDREGCVACEAARRKRAKK